MYQWTYRRFKSAASIIKGRKVAKSVQALVVPGSGVVKQIAEEEGIKDIFVQAGFEWRDPGVLNVFGYEPLTS